MYTEVNSGLLEKAGVLIGGALVVIVRAMLVNKNIRAAAAPDSHAVIAASIRLCPLAKLVPSGSWSEASVHPADAAC